MYLVLAMYLDHTLYYSGYTSHPSSRCYFTTS